MQSTLKNKPTSRLLAFWLVLVFIISLAGCIEHDHEAPAPLPVETTDPLRPGAAITTSLAGIVLDEAGNPLSGVSISVHGETTTTSADGLFRLEDIRVPGNRCIITGEKAGYFTSVRAEVPHKDGDTAVKLYLMSSAPTHTLDAAAGGTATLSNGSKVEIPANGLVTVSGQAYTGEVKMSVRYQDPSHLSFGSVVAGGDMLARRTDERSSILYSYGILRVVLSGSAGEKLQLAAGKSSTLTVAIPQSQLATAPATIPLWYFDEVAGFWQEEGSATRQGDKYIGTVTHFTDWNCDDPKESATIVGTVVDCKGDPIIMGDVFVGQSTSDLSNGYEIDNNGDGPSQKGFSIRVPAGTPLMVIVPPPLIFTLTANEATSWVMVPVPPLSPGQVYDVGAIKPEPCPSLASGRFKLKPGDQVQSLMVNVKNAGNNSSLYKGLMAVETQGTGFSMNFLAANTTYAMQVMTESGLVVTKDFHTTAAGEAVDLGEIDLTGLQLIPVEGLVLCQHAPIANATVTLVWPSGSASTTTNTLGLYSFSMPVGTPGTVSVSHTRGTGTHTFQTPTNEEGYRISTVNICAVNPDTGENSFVISGDGYNAVKKSINLSPYPDSFVYFDRDQAITNLSMADVSKTLSVSLIFPGKSVGAVEEGSIGGARISIKSGGKTVSYWAGFGSNEAGVNIAVSRYEAVSGLVEGTFSGTFVGDNGSTVTISEGKFSVIRYYDFSGQCGGFCM